MLNDFLSGAWCRDERGYGVGRRLALLIATYAYQDPGLRRLTAPAHDAEALAGVLADPRIAGFEVTTLINEPHHVVGAAIGAFYRDLRRDDLTLLYFTGHGLKDDAGRLYLAMADTRRDNLLFTGLAAERIDQAMEGCVSRQKVLVLDCCYSGAFPAGWLAKGDNDVHTLERFGGRGRTVLTASDATQYSFEGTNRPRGEAPRSVFTRHLVAGLRDGSADLDGDGDITLDELYGYVYDRVVEERPEQRPKKQDNVEGRTVIARNVNWALPAHLRHAIGSPVAADRRSALGGLAHLHRIGNDLVRGQVLDVIGRLADDDSRAVSAAAVELQRSLGVQPEAPPADPPPPPLSAPTPPAPEPRPPTPSPTRARRRRSPSPTTATAPSPTPATPRSRWLTIIGGVLALAAAVLISAGGTGGMDTVASRYLTPFSLITLLAGTCVLVPKLRAVFGPGVLLGVAIAGIWGVVGFGVDLPQFPWHHKVLLFTPAGHVTLLLAAAVTLAGNPARFTRAKNPLGRLPILLITIASAGVAIALLGVHADNQLFRSAFLVATFVTIIPVQVARLTERAFALAVLAGWVAGLWVVWSAASADVRYLDAQNSGVSSDHLLYLGAAVVVLTGSVVSAYFRARLPRPRYPFVVTFLLAAALVVVPGSIGYFTFVDRSGPTVLPHGDAIAAVAFTEGGRALVSVTTNGQVRRWDLKTRQVTSEFQTDRDPLVGFSADGGTIAVAGRNQHAVRTWKVATGEAGPILTTIEPISAVALSPNGNMIAAAAGSSGTLLWNTTLSERADSLPEAYVAGPVDVAFSPDGNSIATMGHKDKNVRLWSVRNREANVFIEPARGEQFGRLVFSPDNEKLATSIWRGRVAQVWKIYGHTPIAAVDDGTADVRAFSPSGQYFATVGSDNDDHRALVRSTVDGAATASLDGHSGQVLAAAFSPDGKTVATGSADRTVRLWDAATGHAE